MPKGVPPSDRRERRRLKRVVRRIPIRFQAGTLRAGGDIKNLHQEGMFVRSHTLPEPGTEVVVTFTSPSGEKVEVTGTVRWTTRECPTRESQPGFGVYLHAVPEEYLRFFRSLLFATPAPSKD